ncbi:hypothetical protein D3C80_1782890 [compost metagenome]
MNQPLGLRQYVQRINRVCREPFRSGHGQNRETGNLRGVIARVGQRSQPNGDVKTLCDQIGMMRRRNVAYP